MKDYKNILKEKKFYYLLAFLIDMAVFTTFPYLVIQMDRVFGIGLAFSILTIFRFIFITVFSLLYKKIKWVESKLFLPSVLFLASLGFFIYSVSENALLFFIATLMICAAHGLWLSEVTTSLQFPGDQFKSRISFSLFHTISNLGAISGALLSSFLYLSGGFSVISIFTFLGVLIAAIFSWSFQKGVVRDRIVIPVKNGDSLLLKTKVLPILVLFFVITFPIIIYSSLNSFLPMLGKNVDNFRVGFIFVLNSVIVLFFQVPMNLLLNKLRVQSIYVLLFSVVILFSPMFFFEVMKGFFSESNMIYLTVIMISISEITLFPSMGAFLSSFKDSKELAAWYTSFRVVGFGLGNIIWPHIVEFRHFHYIFLIATSAFLVFVSGIIIKNIWVKYEQA